MEISIFLYNDSIFAAPSRLVVIIIEKPPFRNDFLLEMALSMFGTQI